MFNTMIDENKKVMGFYPTNYKLVKVEMDELPKPPETQKAGVDYVMYYNPDTGKIVLKEEIRPLTEAEEAAKKRAELETQVLSIMEALAEIHEHEKGGA